MKPFFRYPGAKWQLAELYGPPKRQVVVEPFAGSAGYSLYWSVRQAILVERDPVIAGIWRWLIHEADEDAIMSLDAGIDDVRLTGYPQPAKDLIGLWFARGGAAPAERLSRAGADSKESAEGRGEYWGGAVRLRLARQVHLVKEWEIIEGDYAAAPLGNYHYHVDPPSRYNNTAYRFGADRLDYAALAAWCRALPTGDVCEAEGADWLPFRPLGAAGEDCVPAVHRIDAGREPPAVFRRAES